MLNPSISGITPHIPNSGLERLNGAIDMNFLPPGITPGDYANMPPEH